eukprot:jgi/Botrbrau1/13380/Bobra.0194s0012.1
MSDIQEGSKQALASSQSAEAGLEGLREIVQLTRADARYAAYHEHLLDRVMRSVAGEDGVSALLDSCQRTLLGDQGPGSPGYQVNRVSCGGCTTPLPYHLLLRHLHARLLVPGVPKKDLEEQYCRLAAVATHQFPAIPWVPVALALAQDCAMRAQDGEARRPSKAAARERILAGLSLGDLGTAGFLGAWETLARLHVQQGNWQAAMAAAKKGLRHLTAAGQDPLDAALLGNAFGHVTGRLRLLMGRALLELGQRDDAERNFNSVAGGHMGSHDAEAEPVDRAAAQAGLACLLWQKGSTDEAVQLLREASTWDAASPLIAADLGWRLFSTSHFQEARQCLEDAVQRVQHGEGGTTDYDLARVRLWLGRVYWGLRDRSKTPEDRLGGPRRGKRSLRRHHTRPHGLGPLLLAGCGNCGWA